MVNQKGMVRDMKWLAPSILAADFNCLGKQIKELEQCGITMLHFDVMDGVFVPAISFGMPVLASIRKESSLFFDVHLMVEDPVRYIKDFVDCGADSITVHVEACKDVEEVLCDIKSNGVQCGIALNPVTPAEEAVPYLRLADVVLVMSVQPGFGGQKLIPETLEKVKFFADYRKEKGLLYKIEIDGGIKADNSHTILSMGVDIIVAGTGVFGGNISENVRNIRKLLEEEQ